MSRCDIRIVVAGDIETRPIFASSRLLRDLTKKWNELLSSAEICDKKSDKDCDNKNTIYIPQIPQNVMENVIKYINATFVDSNPPRIPICDENVQDYFSAGQFLEMEEIQTFCLDYVKTRESTLENGPFLFKLIGAFENSDADKIVALKINYFFTQNEQQLDVVVRNCKNEGVSEDTLIKLLVNWLNTDGDLNGINLDLDLDKLIQEFTNLENKLKILQGFHRIGDLQVKNEAFHLLLNLAQNLNNSHHDERLNSPATQNENEVQNPHGNMDIDIELLKVENFKVDLDNLDNLPISLSVQINQLEKNEEFPSFTFVNHCFFESESLRQEFCFISPLRSCSENQRKNWLCDAHSKCTNKFSLTKIDQPPVFIKKSNISGIGLFAKSRLVEGQIIGAYTGKITKTCPNALYSLDIFDGDKNKYTIDASEYGNLGRFANSELSATPNAEFVVVLGSARVMPVLTVVKEIAPDEEIIAHYGGKFGESPQKDTDCNDGNSFDFSTSTLHEAESPSVSFSHTSPVHFPPEAASSCKRRRIEVPETENNTDFEYCKSKESEIGIKEEVIERDSSPTFSSSSSSSSVPSTLSSSSSLSSEPEPKLMLTKMGKTYLRTRALVSVSPPQRIIYFRLGTSRKPQGLQLWSFNLKTHNFREELGLQGVFNCRRRFTMLQHNGEIYFMGGEDCRSGILTDEVHIFNLESQSWRFMQMVKRRCSFKTVVLNNSIYAVGGRLENPAGPEKRKLGTKTVEKLSLNSPSSKWEHDSFLLKSRSDAGLVVLDGKIYAIGGYVGEEKGEVMTSSRRCECFDPVVGNDKDKGRRWSPIAPMTYSRLGLAAVATSDRIFALGGAFTFDENDQGLKIVEIYDPETNSWKFGPPMIRRRKFLSAVLFDYCIYAIGGDCFSDEPTMEKFDLRTQKWTVVCSVKADGKFSTIAFS